MQEIIPRQPVVRHDQHLRTFLNQTLVANNFHLIWTTSQRLTSRLELPIWPSIRRAIQLIVTQEAFFYTRCLQRACLCLKWQKLNLVALQIVIKQPLLWICRGSNLQTVWSIKICPVSSHWINSSNSWSMESARKCLHPGQRLSCQMLNPQIQQSSIISIRPLRKLKSKNF